uniref:NB-ARC domain-containing protein n=1 Tax=Solanum lycopersicum TaxID=4081 RepID=A0A3Q7IUQ6_SOLLC
MPLDSSLGSIILADREGKRQKACISFYKELLKVEQKVYFLKKEVMLVEFNNHGSKSQEISKNFLLNTTFDRLIAPMKKLIVIPIFGMDGIDKKTLARKVYDNSYVCSPFDKHASVTISEDTIRDK